MRKNSTMNTDTLDLITKLFSLFSAAISCSAASVAFVSSRRSKRNANTALNAQTEIDQLYKKFLIEMSEAAKTTASIQTQQIQEIHQDQLQKYLRQWIALRTDDFFTFGDITNWLTTGEQKVADPDSVLQALQTLIDEHAIKEVSAGSNMESRCYHRIKQKYV